MAPTLFHLGVSAYQEVMWLIFPRTRPQSQDKTPMLGWVQQAYWECLLIKIPPIIVRSARYLAEIVAIWGHLGFTKNVQIILNSPKIIFKLIFNFSADIWRMFYDPEEVGWDIARGLLRYIAVGDASEGVHLFG